MTGQQADDVLTFFGVDGATGEYLLQANTSDVSALAQDEELPGAHVRDVRQRLQSQRGTLGVADTVDDPSDLAQAGWGVIFADNADPAIRDALGPLLRRRAEQACAGGDSLYQEYVCERGYHARESKRDFLTSRGAAPAGPVEPTEMPYYLLLVGSPEAIPYSVQYQLDVQYAVGRICFDTPEQYACYAESVIAAETANPLPRQVTFFAVRNNDDEATRLSSTFLVQPLAERLRTWQASQPETHRWTIGVSPEDQTSKKCLKALLGGEQTPALLFTASHGLAFASGDARQIEEQGALVCRDWPGTLEWRGPLSSEFYFAGQDVEHDGRVAGLIAFHFACFGAGTPYRDDFPRASQIGLGDSLARVIAERPFVARLAQRLVGHPAGGALAVIGHVERALGSSFVWSSSGGQRASITSFEACLRRLMRGQPVGLAMEALNQRYAEMCVDLSQAIRQVTEEGRLVTNEQLSRLWTGSTDARGYVVVGDPAVSLVGLQGQPVHGDVV
jgi:hypothetical protein